MIYRASEIRKVQLELTSRCNAACPQCPRNHFGGKTHSNLPIVDLSLEDLKNIFPSSFIKQLELFYFCGTYGDPINSQHLIDAIIWLRSQNPTMEIGVNSNASARPERWWQSLAAAIGEKGYVTFSIDGLKDTNPLYRRNTNFDMIIRNAKAFIQAGGTARWDFIIFSHNEHQVEACQKLATDMGFSKFTAKRTGRFIGKDHQLIEKHPVLNRSGKTEYFLEQPKSKAFLNAAVKKMLVLQSQNIDIKAKLENADINCLARRRNEVYVSAEGLVLPCGWIHDRFYGVQAEGTPSSSQILSWVEQLGGKEKLDARFHGIMEIIEGPFFSQVARSWALNSFNDGRCERCAMICGDTLSPVKTQYNDTEIRQFSNN